MPDVNRSYTCPDLTNAPGALLCVPIPLIPFFRQFFAEMQRTYPWRTRDDWYRGYQAFAQMEETLMAGCLTDLVESNNRIYRLLDTVLNGAGYFSTPNPADPDRPLIYPDIPATPPVQTTHGYALRAQIARIYQLMENAATGAEFVSETAIDGTGGLDYSGSWRARIEALQGLTGGFFGIGATPVTLADLLKAGRVNTADDQGLINDGIEEVLNAVSAGASIANVLTNLLETGADVASDGGVIATMLAASVANSITAGLLAGKIDRLIAAMDGGGLTAPSTNVLARLTSIDGNLQP